MQTSDHQVGCMLFQLTFTFMLQTIRGVNNNGTKTCIRRPTFFFFWCAANFCMVREEDDMNVIVWVLHVPEQIEQLDISSKVAEAYEGLLDQRCLLPLP